ncbi:MAG TPA: accessory factor UbiK family protein [Gammaproteobacteria bacterium]|nr:accessory factor UbiK family protein [Gammaproteobacteria bacterium]
MIDPKKLEEIAQKLGAALPDGLQAIQRDVEKNFKTILQNSFARMDLVTREEFDVQTEVLKRSREKLDSMAHQIQALEAKLRE